MLDTVAGKPIIVPHKVPRKPCPMAHLTLRDDSRGIGDPDMALAFMPAGLTIGSDGIDVLKPHFGGRYMKAWYVREADGKIYGKLQYSIDKPDWW